MTYLLFGLLLNEYPDNYAFELTSRLLPLYGIKNHITNLIKQCDEQSPRHCALIVPYCQLQPPGSGLIYTMNKHTLPVVDLDFTNNQMAAISLSNKIILINMQTGNTALDIKLPKLNEPYLNSTTLPKMIVRSSKKTDKDNDDDSDTSDSDSSDDDNAADEKFKGYVFFVNSSHNVYLVSSHGDIKFQQTSTIGFSTVEVISNRRGLCITAEKNSNCVNCWSVGENKLHAKIELSPTASIKTVVHTKLATLLIAVVLHDGTILFYVLDDTKFIHRATINAGKHLDIVVADKDRLICSFDATVAIDFSFIDLKPIAAAEKVFSEKDLIIPLVAFNPPIGPKPIQQIVLPENKEESMLSGTINFMALTKESLCLVHTCQSEKLSYIPIPGQFDVVAMHAKTEHLIYTSRGGTIYLYKWRCKMEENEKESKVSTCHEYQLLVCIDISSSPVLTIKPNGDSGMN